MDHVDVALRRAQLITTSQGLRSRAHHLVSRSVRANLQARLNRLDYIRHRATFLMRQGGSLPFVVQQAMQVVSGSLARQLTLKELGRLVGLSPWHLNVVFHHATGMTVHEYATSQRMRYAATEIRKGTKVEAIAHAVGYRSRETFYRQFKKWFRVNPRDLRPASRAGKASPPIDR
jgi:AraC-like DNA-binding protein